MLELVKRVRNTFSDWLPSFRKDPGESPRNVTFRLLAGFFALMLALTILSRAADSLTVARVDTASPQSGTLVYDVEAEGSIDAKKEKSITTRQGLRVLDVFVEEGQHVSAGDPLIEFDSQDVEEQLATAKGELQKLVLQKKEQLLTGSTSASAVDTAQSALDAAKENYDEAVLAGRIDIERAQADLTRANEEYSRAVYQADQSQSQTRQQAIDGAQKELDNVTYSRAEALRTAQRAVEDAQTALDSAKATGTAASIATAQKALDRAQEDQAAAVSHWDALLAKAQTALNSAKSATTNATQAQESAFKAVQAAQRALQDTVNSQKTKEHSAQRAIDTAQEQLDNAKKDAGIRTQQAALQAQSLDIDIQAKQRVVDTLAELTQNNVLTAPENGFVQIVAAKVGQRTSGEELIHLACADQGAKFHAQLDEDQAKHVALGDLVAVTLDNENVPISATVESISSADADKRVRITAALSQSAASKAKPGDRAKLRTQKRSKTYSSCLPISAIRRDSGGDYVLVLRESNSVLGKESTAARINVTVTDSDRTTVAISIGIDPKSRVITGSNKPLEAGDRVRLRES